jgi:hypothetical protein
MAKGQMRSNKEKRKPKQDKSKAKPAAAPPRFSPTPINAGSTSGGKKS